MERVLKIITEYQWWIYGVLGLALIFYLRRAILARRDTVRSIFRLEQEQARARYNRSVAISAFVLLIVIAAFGLTNPLLPQPVQTPLPTLTLTSGPLVRPTLTPTVAVPTTIPTLRTSPPPPTQAARPSPTVAQQAVPTTAPVVAPPPPPACPNPNIRITSPGMNQVVTGNVPVRGTANTEGFQYYKIEVAPGGNPQDNQWSVVGELHYTPVGDGVLAQFNSGAYPAGIYTLRLVVVDQTGNYPEPCRVTVNVQH